MKSLEELSNLSKQIRQDIFLLNSRNGSGHYASSLSCVEILVSLYFGDVLDYDPKQMDKEERDHFIMSKGQGATALYSTLYHAGVFERERLESYCTKDSRLGGLVTEYLPYGIEGCTGSLGHGLGFAGGIALNGKIRNKEYSTFVLLGDGECQEGTIWEAALAIPQLQLNHLIAIIDYNRLQASDWTDKIIDMSNMKSKWESFGWFVEEVDGHDIEALIQSFTRAKDDCSRPQLIIAKTVKGKGISFMENSVDWHCRSMDDTQMSISRRELEIDEQ